MIPQPSNRPPNVHGRPHLGLPSEQVPDARNSSASHSVDCLRGRSWGRFKVQELWKVQALPPQRFGWFSGSSLPSGHGHSVIRTTI